MVPDTQRTPTAIDRIAEQWVDSLVALDPTVGTYIGRASDGSGFADYSPEGTDRYITEATAVISAVDRTPAVDDVDLVTRTDLRSTLTLDLEGAAAGLQLRDLNVIASPAQGIREVFDLMPTGTV